MEAELHIVNLVPRGSFVDKDVVALAVILRRWPIVNYSTTCEIEIVLQDYTKEKTVSGTRSAVNHISKECNNKEDNDE